MTRVECTAGSLTRHAAYILRHQRISITTAVRTIIDFVRPHVIGGKQDPVSERALHGDRQPLVATVVLGAPPVDLTESWVGPQSGQRVYYIYFREGQEMCALASYIRDCSDDLVGESLLERQSPLSDVSIFTAAILRARRDDTRRIRQKGIDRKAQVRL